MSEQSRTTLKSYFETADTPTEAQFIDLFDSMSTFQDEFTTKYVKTSLNSSQILNLNSTPITMVASPGAGKLLVPLRLIYSFVWNSIQYTASGGSQDLVVYYSSQSIPSNNIWTGNYLGGSTDLILKGTYFSDTNAYESDSIKVTTEDSNPANGNSTADFYLWYIELTL